jgi:hypothetical protein
MEEFRPIISGIIGGTIATIAVAWAANDSKKPITKGTAIYGWRMRLMAIAISCLCLFISYAAFHASKDQRVIAWSLAGACLVIAAVSLLEVFITKFVAQKDGLQIRTPWRGTRTIPWQVIGQCSYRPILEVHEIKTNGFGKLYLSNQLAGTPGLLSIIKQRGTSRAS